jgi:hypothetical protein
MKKKGLFFGLLSIAFCLVGFLVSILSCASYETTTDLWNFAELPPPTVEGLWMEEDDFGAEIYQFEGNRFGRSMLYLAGNDMVLPRSQGNFRIRGNNLELITTRYNKYEFARNYSEAKWVDYSYNYDEAPHFVFSFEIKDDVLVLKCTGGTVAGNLVGKTIELKRQTIQQ